MWFAPLSTGAAALFQEKPSEKQNPEAHGATPNPKQEPPAAETALPPKNTADGIQEKKGPPKPTSSAEAIIQEIAQRDRQREILKPVDPRTKSGGALWPEGTPIVERAGRLIKDGETWVFVFESDHPTEPEPPVKLLPNLILERMVWEAQIAKTSPVYLVSGEFTEFFGENHLLIRLAQRQMLTTKLSK